MKKIILLLTLGTFLSAETYVCNLNRVNKEKKAASYSFKSVLHVLPSEQNVFYIETGKSFKRPYKVEKNQISFEQEEYISQKGTMKTFIVFDKKSLKIEETRESILKEENKKDKIDKNIFKGKCTLKKTSK